MKLTVVIPARMSSSRFPGKPLADILGLPMIEHVRRRVLLHPDVEDAIVATCDDEILNVVISNGGKSVMTSPDHYCCNDRVAEASQGIDADIIINVQGDEALFNPEMLNYLIEPYQQDPSLKCINLMTKIRTDEEFYDINEVKVVCDLKNNALYLSREPIPSGRKTKSKNFPRYKQLGIYALQKELLSQFLKWGPSPWESIETVDMLRLLEHGHLIRMAVSPFETISVDTPKDLELVKQLMKKDPLFEKYA